MTLQQLEYIVAIDRYRHFAQAAQACGVTQSTLSALVHKLEEELDVVIFDRNAHPVIPTRAGEKVIAQAHVVLYNSQQLREMTLSERQRIEGDIRMAITPTIAPYILPKLFSFVTKNYPMVRVKAREFHREIVIEKLKKADIDMAIMSLAHNDADLLEIPLYHEKLVAYVSPRDPLYNLDEISSQELPANRLWALKHEICFQPQIPDFCNFENATNSTYESGCMPALVMIVDENGGFTVMPELHIPLLRDSMQRNIRPLVNPVPVRNVSLFVRKDYVREGLLNVIADGVKSIVPPEMLDERLSKYRIHL